MKKMNWINISLLILAMAGSVACDKETSTSTSNSNHGRNFGIFTVLSSDTIAEMNGEINSQTLVNFNDLVSAYPNVNRINITNCEGSSDDETNLKVSLLVHRRNISTHLENNGLIASGGVDFFLAGITRTRGSNTQIGVHSWGGEDDNGNTVTATDFPVGHQYHLPYIEYYKSVGFSQADAEAFYYFTINAAAAEDIHWMTDAEVTQYKVLKD
jgi:hypothetical protein